MKTVTGKIISAEPISLSKAATLLSGFASSDNGASQAVSAYLQRASAAFTELKSIHREIKSSSSLKQTKKRRSEARHERNTTGEFDEAKEIDDLVENGGKTQKHDEIEEDKKKKKKKKSKKKKEEDVEEEQRDEDRKEKKKKRKSDGEMGSEERKSKKKRRSKEIDD